MQNTQQHVTRHLRMEELESRSMMAVLAAVPVGVSVVTANLEGNSALVGGGFPSDTSAALGAAAAGSVAITNPAAAAFQVVGIPVPGQPGFSANGQPGVGLPGIGVALTVNGSLAANTSGPDSAGGVGQMTITTGANTPGISSFASPIAGYAGASVGTGFLLKQPSGDDLDSLFESLNQ